MRRGPRGASGRAGGRGVRRHDERAETLDRKLAVIASSTAAFVDLQDTARSLRLEAIIVILILAELAVALFPLFASTFR